jgi:hypothetical protein
MSQVFHGVERDTDQDIETATRSGMKRASSE